MYFQKGELTVTKEIGEVLDALREGCYPFFLLSPQRFQEAAEFVKLLELAKGESFSGNTVEKDDYVYVLEGAIALRSGQDSYRVVHPKDSRNRPIFMSYLPDSTTMEAMEDTLLCHASSEVLDYLLFWDEASRSIDPGDKETRSRMEMVKRAAAFRRLPPESVWEMIKRMRPMTAKKGQEVVRQGEEGDAYYMLTSGHAEVWEMGLHDEEQVKVNEMQAGDAFGEHALLTGGTRSATVRMMEDGNLLVLDRVDFDELVSKPLFREVDPEKAQRLIAEGYGILDVRYEEEREESYIPGSFLVPLHVLRHRFDEFEKDKSYLVYCRGGKRSSVATLLLNQNQIDAVSLSGGILDWPYELAEG